MKSNSDRILDRIVIGQGDTVFKEGDQGNRAYIVQEGRVDIFQRNEHGEEVRLGSVATGGIFGEMALIDDQPRMASARAAEKSTLVVIARSVVQQKLQSADPFIRGLVGILARNVRTLAAQRAPTAQDEQLVALIEASAG